MYFCDQSTFVDSNADCLSKVGIEPANLAFITRDGTQQAPPAPLGLTLESFTPGPFGHLHRGVRSPAVPDLPWP